MTMENPKIGFFEETPNQKSSTRLQMFITMFFAFLVIGYQTYANENHTPDFLTMVVLLSSAFAPKTIQKFAEMQEKNKP